MTRAGVADAFQAQIDLTSAADDPVGWATRVLGAHLWSRQRDILTSLHANRYTAVKSAHGVGKTYTAAAAVAWWLATHPPESTTVVTTAPTAHQVEKILWQEIRRMKDRGHLVGRITGGAVPTWKVGEEVVAFGRKPADYDQDAFQGIHARFVLVILDEAGGIPASLYEEADSLATNDRARVLAIGNPTDPTSHFATICAPGSGWNVLTISAFDSPAFTGEDVPAELLEDLVGPTWVDERRKRWGESSPAYVSRVLGQFPSVTEDGLISPALIEAAQLRDLSGVDAGCFGCDVARTGSDRTAIYRNRGGVVRADWYGHEPDTMQTTGRIAMRLHEHPAVPAIVDVIGVGSGVVDRLREQDLNVVAFNSSARPYAPRKFRNRRAEAYWTMREAFERGEVDLDPADEDLAAQLGAIKWFVDSSGRIYIESKDDMRRRGMPSPDRADAVMMSFFQSGVWTPNLMSATQYWRLHGGIEPMCSVFARMDGVSPIDDDDPRPPGRRSRPVGPRSADERWAAAMRRSRDSW